MNTTKIVTNTAKNLAISRNNIDKNYHSYYYSEFLGESIDCRYQNDIGAFWVCHPPPHHRIR